MEDALGWWRNRDTASSDSPPEGGSPRRRSAIVGELKMPAPAVGPAEALRPRCGELAGWAAMLRFATRPTRPPRNSSSAILNCETQRVSQGTWHHAAPVGE